MSLIITQGFGPDSEMGSVPVVISVACMDSSIVKITFLEPIRLEASAEQASSWSIQPLGHLNSVSVVQTSYSDNIITLTTTDHIEGLRYRLTLPALGVLDADTGSRYPGPFEFEYGGVSLPPYIVIVKGVDQTAIDVVYSEPVVTEEALEPQNYSIIGPGDVKVLSVEKLNDISYRLSTTRQVRLAGYTVEVENVHDLSGKVIVSDHS